MPDGLMIAIGGKDPGAAKRNKRGLPPLLGMKADDAEPSEKGGGPANVDPPEAPPKPDPMPPMPEPEGDEGEAPDYHADIAAVGEKYGADAETSMAFTLDALEALLKCLRGKGANPIAEHDAGGMPIEGDQQ